MFGFFHQNRPRLPHRFYDATCGRKCIMRLAEFAPLSETQKVTLLYEQGVYIGKRRQGPTTVVLYQLDGFYAEIFYRSYRRVIDRISCFSGIARLDPYLAAIDVEDLVL